MIRLAILLLLITFPLRAEPLRLAVTTSFQNSGLADVLLPAIAQDTGLEVQLLVVGTGQALRLGRGGDVDALLVHDQAAEEAFVAAGHAPYRREIMYNDFVITGPLDDPARVAEASSATDALHRIRAAQAAFVSRGDESGTHKAELRLWQNADWTSFGPWYRSVGAGMGTSLNIAAGMGAYILTDRASWLNFENKRDQVLHFSGDPMLLNRYSYLPVSLERHSHINASAALRLEEWLISDAAKTLINGYRRDGSSLFTFSATR